VVTLLVNPAPIITQAICQNQTVQLGANGTASLNVNLLNNGSTGNTPLSFAVNGQTTLNYTCSNVGNNSVTLTLTDGNGTTSTCMATVTVQDNIAPTITCPNNISVNNDTGQCGATVNWSTPSTADNCSVQSVSQTLGLGSGSTFSVGTQTIAYQVEDASGNTSSCSFTVIVNDTELPVIACPPSPQVFGTNNGCFYDVSSVLLDATATDNCSVASLTHNFAVAPNNTSLNGLSFPA
jgi:hypothetical protein